MNTGKEKASTDGSRYQDLVDEIHTIDPYFNSLIELREDLAEIFSFHLKTEE